MFAPHKTSLSRFMLSKFESYYRQKQDGSFLLSGSFIKNNTETKLQSGLN